MIDGKQFGSWGSRFLFLSVIYFAACLMIFGRADSQWVIQFLGVIFWALIEEILFRRYLLSGLVGRLGLIGAITISSLIFALCHFNLSSIIPLFLNGALLGVVFVLTRGVTAGTLLHAASNIAVAGSVEFERWKFLLGDTSFAHESLLGLLVLIKLSIMLVGIFIILRTPKIFPRSGEA